MKRGSDKMLMFERYISSINILAKCFTNFVRKREDHMNYNNIGPQEQ